MQISISQTKNLRVSAVDMVVLGIDPGTRRLGWGVIRLQGTRLVHIAHGVIAADQHLALATRLVGIEAELDRVVLAHRPNHASVEGIFFAKDAQAAAKLGHARGVALLVCARRGLAIAEYPPARAKRTVTGRGDADKKQVAKMVQVVLGLLVPPEGDAADALALAITHIQRTPSRRLLGVTPPIALDTAPGRRTRKKGADVALLLARAAWSKRSTRSVV